MAKCNEVRSREFIKQNKGFKYINKFNQIGKELKNKNGYAFIQKERLYC